MVDGYTLLTEIGSCPHCRGGLEGVGDAVLCKGECGEKFYYTADEQIDCRLKQPLRREIEFEIPVAQLEFDSNADVFEPEVPQHPNPDVDFSDIDIPDRMRTSLMSHIPEADAEDVRMLDLGCGDGTHKELVEQAGYEWVGIDISSDTAPVLGDSRSLPFDDNIFDAILSIAVLEHTSNPFLMAQEIRRVSKSGSKFIGSVGFTEPLHGDSHFHHSPLGIQHVLQEAGFEIDFIAPYLRTGLKSHGRRLFYVPPGFPNAIHELVTYIHKPFIDPLQTLHDIWYKTGGLLLGSGEKEGTLTDRKLRFTSHIAFVCRV